MKALQLYRVLLLTVALLSLPAIAMLFTTQVQWSFSDFLIMGSLLLITGLVFELVLSIVGSRRLRLLIAGSVLLVFLLLWIELSVGIFGTPIAGS